MKKSLLAGLLLLSTITVANAASNGGVIIGNTRLVYMEGASSLSVLLKNKSSDLPYLMKVKISESPEGKGNTPFFVSPPLFRLNADSDGVVRIVGDGRNLPRDRESVFYFTATSIPSTNPLARGNSDGYLSGGIVLSTSSVIKLFWRPKGLASSSEEAIKALKFSVTGGDVMAKNDSPYYVSLASLKIGGKSVDLDGKTGPEMLAPFSQGIWHVRNHSGRVEWFGVNDLGGIVAGSEGL